MSQLLEDPKTASATHNILGYRVLDESSGKVVQVCFLSKSPLFPLSQRSTCNVVGDPCHVLLPSC